MLNKLRVYAQKKSLTVNTPKSELPPLFFDGTQLPYTDTYKYLGMVSDRQINLNIAADAALRPFMAGTFRVNSSRAMTLLTDCMLISGSSKRTHFLLACMRVRYGLLPSYDNVERNPPPTEMAFDSAEKDSQRHHFFMVRCARVRPGAPANLTGFVLQCVCTIPLPNATVPR